MITSLIFLFACGQAPPAPADCPECPSCEEATEAPTGESPAVALTEWEAEVLSEPLAELRAGVTLHSDTSFGICPGVQRCEDGAPGVTDPGTLPTGDHIIFAELQVPELGGQWGARFHLECVTTSANGSTSDWVHDREFEVRNGGPTRGFRLMPLARVKAPHPAGARECSYSLTPITPDGREGEPFTGSYSTAAPE